MDNAELFESGLSRIIVPTVYREDYIMSLKKFTNRKEPDNPNKLRLNLNGMNILDYWFKQKFDELQKKNEQKFQIKQVKIRIGQKNWTIFLMKSK